MGKYNFNYDRIKTLEAQNAQLNVENSNLKENVEGLTKAMEALAKEVLELKQNGARTKGGKPKGFSAYISAEAQRKLFSTMANKEGKLVKADSSAIHTNLCTFYNNIVRAIAPVVRITDKRASLQAKPMMNMSEAEQKAIGEAIQKCAEICLETKKKLEGIK